MALSDHGYKLLFSQPCIVSSLLRDIVPALDGGWTDILALEHMTPVRSELISNTLQRRHGDLIWRIPRKDRHELFLVLMLEFQSRTDHAMALRLTTYRSLLYEDLLARTPSRPGKPCPPYCRWSYTLVCVHGMRAATWPSSSTRCRHL